MGADDHRPDDRPVGCGGAGALTDAERLDWLRLIRSENVGPATFRELTDHFGSATAALEALPELARRGGGAGGVRAYPIERAEKEVARAARCGARLVALGETGYPPRLAKIDAPPPILFVKGEMGLADRPMIAIVGSRNGSAIGQKFTRRLARDFGTAGFVVASGLARGIDSAAHHAGIETGTVALVAGGIDVVYPPENADLQNAIGERGLLISERPPGLRPKARDFPRRNRLISGVSVAVVVVEAAARSGSLITARMAGEQGREVFAVPGNPLDPRAAGTNRLLREGAGLVSSANDVVEALAPMLGREPEPGNGLRSGAVPQAGPPPRAEIAEGDRGRVLAVLGVSPVDIDELIRATELTAREVHVVLLELDLAGRLERHGQQLVSLVSADGRR